MLLFLYLGEYSQSIADGMAWGMTTESDNKFWPILYIKNFQMAAKNSGSFSGQLILNYCDLLLTNGGIIGGNVKMKVDDILGAIYFQDTATGNLLLSISPDSTIQNAEINILDKIKFFKNQLGSNSLKIGTSDDYVLMTDDGGLFVMGHAMFGTSSNKVNFDVYPTVTANIWGNLDVDGNVYADNISSDRRLKKNIKNSSSKAIEIIKQIKHRQFEMKKDGSHYNIGYIAQELEKIDKNFVIKKEKNENSEERYYVNELPIIATITKAIQEQQELIEKLQENDKKKDKLISELTKRLEKLEKEACHGKDTV